MALKWLAFIQKTKQKQNGLFNSIELQCMQIQQFKIDQKCIYPSSH